MHVTILGAGTSIPSPGHSPAGIYVKAGDEHVLLDAGPGTLQRLHAVGVTYRQLDRIFLTHYHVDHCLDLVAMLFACRIPRPRRTKPLMIYGPKGLRAFYRRLNAAFHGWLEPRTYRLALTEIGDATLRLPGYSVRAARMRHSTVALGYRLESRGTSIAYSGDTDVCDEVVRLGREADLLILECSHPDGRKVEGHLTPSACGRIAAAARCKRLVLTHFYPAFTGCDIPQHIRRFYRGPLTLAQDFVRLV